MPATSRARVADTPPPVGPSAAPVVGESAFSFHGECGTDGRRAVVVTQLRVVDGVCHRDRIAVGERQLAGFLGGLRSAAGSVGVTVGTAPDGVTPILPDEARDAGAYAARVAAVRHQHPNAYAAWTDEQDRRLADLHRAGLTVAEIGYQLGRQDGAVAIRLTARGFDAPAVPAAVPEVPPAAVTRGVGAPPARRGRGKKAESAATAG